MHGHIILELGVYIFTATMLTQRFPCKGNVIFIGILFLHFLIEIVTPALQQSNKTLAMTSKVTPVEDKAADTTT